MTEPPDPRRHAYRADLAAERLRGSVAAERYACGEVHYVTAPALPVRREPRADAPLDTEVLHGEVVTVYDEFEGWAWGQLDADGHVGYMPSVGLAQGGFSPTHRVSALRTYVLPVPDSKAPPLSMLSLHARLSVAEEAGNYLRLASGGFIFARHATPVNERVADFVTVAEKFRGAPYLWGGRTSVGLDCSGLVQLSAASAGHSLPRDADMQEAEAGEPVDWHEAGAIARGDLVFWEGHVGIMSNAQDIVHANAFHMAVEIEPLKPAADRIEQATGFRIRNVRRLPRSP